MKVMQINQQNQTSFKMNLKFENDETKRLFQKGWEFAHDSYTQKGLKDHFGNKPFNFEKMFIKLKEQTKKITHKIKGDIIIAKDKSENKFGENYTRFNLTYSDESGNIFKSETSMIANDLLPSRSMDKKGKPFSNAINLILITSGLKFNLANNSGNPETIKALDKITKKLHGKNKNILKIDPDYDC